MCGNGCVNGLMLTQLTCAFVCMVLAKTQHGAKEAAVPSMEIWLSCGVCTGLCMGVSLQRCFSPRCVKSFVKRNSFNYLFFFLFFPFSIRSVMQKYLEERGELTFDKIFHQRIGESFCNEMLFL